MAQPYKNLVLKGGGIRGIAYAGALHVLEEKGFTVGIERVAGTSVGAITGLLFSLGYSSSEIEKLLYGIDISSFNDGEGFFIGGSWRMTRRFGWYKGIELENWLAQRIKERTGSTNTTFNQLHQMTLTDKRYRDLYVTATNLTYQRLDVFDWEHYPDMELKTAVRASAAIPLYYGAVFLDSAGGVIANPTSGAMYNVYVDGGLLANYPLDIFTDSVAEGGRVSKYTLGLKLERPEQIVYDQQNKGIAPYDISSFKDYMAALYNLTIVQLNKGVPAEEERKHTIYISTSNLSPRVRGISDEQKRLLIANGEAAARLFFEGNVSAEH